MSVDGQGNVHVSDRPRTRYGQAHMISANGSVRTSSEIRTDVGLAASPGGRLFALLSSERLVEITARGNLADEQHVRAIIDSTGEGFDLIGKSGAASVRSGPLVAAANGVSGLSVLPDGNLAVSTAAENPVPIAR